MSDLYSQRNAPTPDDLRYDVPSRARLRLWQIICEAAGKSRTFFDRLQSLLSQQYGDLAGRVEPTDPHPMSRHLIACSDGQALDFIEACFRLPTGVGGQDLVEQINRVFRQEGLGYELTDYKGPELAMGEWLVGGSVPDEELPLVIRVDHKDLHDSVVRPTLQLLGGQVFQVANSEMLKAHSFMRSGDYRNAITECGAAFESVMKTICQEKNWSYDERDGCAQLVSVCREKGLFPPFYSTIFEGVGTIRNKLSSAHGRGPEPQYQATKANAEHMINVASSHILFVAGLAGIE